MEDEEIDELERKRAKQSIEEKKWWDKDGEEGYTSEYDHVEWNWDNRVMGKDEGNLDNGKGSILDKYGNQLDGNKDLSRSKTESNQHQCSYSTIIIDLVTIYKYHRTIFFLDQLNLFVLKILFSFTK